MSHDLIIISSETKAYLLNVLAQCTIKGQDARYHSHILQQIESSQSYDSSTITKIFNALHEETKQLEDQLNEARETQETD